MQKYRINKVHCTDGNYYDFWVFTRGGSSSPHSFLCLKDGKRLTEFEMRLRGFHPSETGTLKLFYGNTDLSSLTYKHNPFLNLIPKHTAINGTHFPVIVIYK